MRVLAPTNSLFDYAIFAIVLLVFHANPTLRHSVYFVRTLVTQTLITFCDPHTPGARSFGAARVGHARLRLSAAPMSSRRCRSRRSAQPWGLHPLPPAFFGVRAALVLS